MVAFLSVGNSKLGYTELAMGPFLTQTNQIYGIYVID